MEEIKEGYTRVSSILGQWNHLAHIDKDVLANKCRIGSNVHAKIAAEMDGIFLDLKPDEEGYFESWKKWWKEEKGLGSIPSLVEKRFYCDELMITGCVDLIINATGGSIIIDYKTSATANKKMWALQAALYHYLGAKNGHALIDEVWFIHLKKDGKKAKVHEFQINPYLRKTCAAAIRTYRYFNG